MLASLGTREKTLTATIKLPKLHKQDGKKQGNKGKGAASTGLTNYFLLVFLCDFLKLLLSGRYEALHSVKCRQLNAGNCQFVYEQSDEAKCSIQNKSKNVAIH